MKTSFKVLLCLLLTFSLTACGKSRDRDDMKEKSSYKDKQQVETMKDSKSSQSTTSERTPVNQEMDITYISHASAVLRWGDTVLYSDPVGGEDPYADQPSPDIVFITHTHGDHMDEETLMNILTPETTMILPQSVADELNKDLPGNRIIMANGETTSVGDITVKAIAAYNLPVAEDSFHPMGQGNGYVFEKMGQRIYFSGDTSGIPEIKALTNIDVAFLCMNLPYTMSVEEAAETVLAFKPNTVLPYHYRGKDGLSDTDKFAELVMEGNPDIEVVQLDWYSEQDQEQREEE